jgi:hypothetical protein
MEYRQTQRREVMSDTDTVAKVYVLTITMESLIASDPLQVVTGVFSSQEKAYDSLVDFCKKEWDEGDTEIPANGGDIVTEYFEVWGDRDNYTIEMQELDSFSWNGKEI